jgi:hypothetical protein
VTPQIGTTNSATGNEPSMQFTIISIRALFKITPYLPSQIPHSGPSGVDEVIERSQLRMKRLRAGKEEPHRSSLLLSSANTCQRP